MNNINIHDNHHIVGEIQASMSSYYDQQERQSILLMGDQIKQSYGDCRILKALVNYRSITIHKLDRLFLRIIFLSRLFIYYYKLYFF